MIVSPNEMHGLDTVIILPMTTKSKSYPMRVPILFQEKSGFLVLDQIRTIDKSRLSKYLGTADPMTGMRALQVLREMFDV
jgi:mRNA interferase MazF